MSAAPAKAWAQSSENVAVVINDASLVSQRIGEYYVQKRALPASNVIHIRTATDETIERLAYARTIEQPIAAALAKEGLQDRVLYLVLTKGVPLRINGTGGVDGTVSSVDSELTLLYRRMTGRPVPTRGYVDNPYFLGTRAIHDARPFSHQDQDIYLVTRLDAFTVEEALALVDKALHPSNEGKIVLDQKNALVNRTGEDWLEMAARRIGDMGQASRVLLETTSKGARDISPVLGYYSWGSNDPANRVRRFNMGFVAGSLAATFVSSDARTFEEPPAGWEPHSDFDDRSTWFAGSPQSLIGDLIREGATGVAGHVGEPYLQSTVRPEILFPAYLAGFSLVESFYLAIPHLSWQTVVIGDPLCRPFPAKLLTRSDLEQPTDAATELPGLFSKRRREVASVQMGAVKPEVLTLLIRADARTGRGNLEGAAKALEEATAADPQLPAAQLQLALMYEQRGNHESAIERYRRVLALQPNNTIALNNLAYSLAVHQKVPAEAKPIAQRALTLAPRDPTVMDTAGWIEHLLGDDVTASRLLTAATKGAPNVAEIRLHAAFAYAGAGAVAAAAVELKEALKLDPALAQREDVQQLTARLQKQASAEADPLGKL